MTTKEDQEKQGREIGKVQLIMKNMTLVLLL